MNLLKFSCFLFYSNIIIRKFSNKIRLFTKKSKDVIIQNNNEKEYQSIGLNQKEYKSSLFNPNINLVICNGPAGTGKTLFACQYAISSLQKKAVDKIIITRPTISIEEDMGFLPGDINSKMFPFTIPIFDIFYEFYNKKEVDSMVQNNIIEIAPLGFMQGRTFKKSIVVADEMQNSTPNQMKMLLTRIGIESKMIITGDLEQTNNEKNGFNDIINKIVDNYSSRIDMNNDGIDLLSLTSTDIHRSEIVKVINKLYKN